MFTKIFLYLALILSCVSVFSGEDNVVTQNLKSKFNTCFNFDEKLLSCQTSPQYCSNECFYSEEDGSNKQINAYAVFAVQNNYKFIYAKSLYSQNSAPEVQDKIQCDLDIGLLTTLSTYWRNMVKAYDYQSYLDNKKKIDIFLSDTPSCYKSLVNVKDKNSETQISEKPEDTNVE